MPDIYTILANASIPYTRYEHPPFFTCEDAEDFYSQVAVGGGTCKNLFIRNRKGDRHYLVLVHSEDRVNLGRLEELLNDKDLSFASPERLEKYLGLKPGSVSPFGLINDANREVIVVVQKKLYRYPTLYFHPNVNTATLGVGIMDFQRFLSLTGNKIIEVDI